MGHILDEMFAWPQGIVVGNLIASFLVWAPHFVYTAIKHGKLNARLERIENAVQSRGARWPGELSGCQY